MNAWNWRCGLWVDDSEIRLSPVDVVNISLIRALFIFVQFIHVIFTCVCIYMSIYMSYVSPGKTALFPSTVLLFYNSKSKIVTDIYRHWQWCFHLFLTWRSVWLKLSPRSTTAFPPKQPHLTFLEGFQRDWQEFFSSQAISRRKSFKEHGHVPWDNRVSRGKAWHPAPWLQPGFGNVCLALDHPILKDPNLWRWICIHISSFFLPRKNRRWK